MGYVCLLDLVIGIISIQGRSIHQFNHPVGGLYGKKGIIYLVSKNSSSMSCPIFEMSYLGNVLSRKCPI